MNKPHSPNEPDPPRMSNELFAKMPPELKLHVMRCLVEDTFGEAQAERMWRQLAPVIADAVGHGDPALIGEGEDFWGGVWKIYDAD